MKTKKSSALETTLAERRTQHGNFTTHAVIAQALKNAMRISNTNWNDLPDDMKEALDMEQHKIARILNGGQNHIDTWHDMAGYATLVENRLREKAANAS